MVLQFTFATVLLCWAMQKTLGQVGVSLPLSAVTVFADQCDENGDGLIDFGACTFLGLFGALVPWLLFSVSPTAAPSPGLKCSRANCQKVSPMPLGLSHALCRRVCASSLNARARRA